MGRKGDAETRGRGDANMVHLPIFISHFLILALKPVPSGIPASPHIVSPRLRVTASPRLRFSRICRIMSTLLASLKQPQVLQSGRQFGLRPAIAIES